MNVSPMLYYFPSCPFCRKVLLFMQDRGITIPMRNILQEPEAAAALAEIGGKTQVPCLVINGKALYESDDIIAWMTRNLLQGKEAQDG